jgi:hypothetical protein
MKGKDSTVDHLTKICCFVKKMNIVSVYKEADLN